MYQNFLLLGLCRLSVTKTSKQKNRGSGAERNSQFCGSRGTPAFQLHWGSLTAAPPQSKNLLVLCRGALGGCCSDLGLLGACRWPAAVPHRAGSGCSCLLVLRSPREFAAGFLQELCSLSAVAAGRLRTQLPFSVCSQNKSLPSLHFSAFVVGRASRGRDRSLSHFRFFFFSCKLTLSTFSGPLQSYQDAYRAKSRGAAARCLRAYLALPFWKCPHCK